MQNLSIQGAELPRQAVAQKGLSTFHNSSTTKSLTADGLIYYSKDDRDRYDEVIAKSLNSLANKK